MRSLLALIVAAFALFTLSTSASAQFAVGKRVGKMSYSHGSVGTSAAAAISSGSVVGNSVRWLICNDAVNGSSTYLAVSSNANPAVDGIRLGLGQCLECQNCSTALLKAINVLGQGASNGYSVTQYNE